MDNKGQISLGNVSAVILTFIIIVLIASIGAEVMQGASDGTNNTVTFSLVNLSVTGSNETNTTLTRFNVINTTLIVTGLQNETNTSVGNRTLGNGEFFLVQASGLYQLTNGTLNGTEQFLSYDYTETERDEQFNTSQDGLTGITNISGKFGLLGTVLILAVVIGVVVAVFAFGGRGV